MITLSDLFTLDDDEIDMVAVALDPTMVAQMYIEDDMEKLSNIQFLVLNFHDGYIGKYRLQFRQISQSIIDRLATFEDSEYHMRVLGKLVEVAKSVGIVIR